MNIFISRSDPKNANEQPDEHHIVHYESAQYTNAGGEFIDDAIRMHDQPLNTEQEGGENSIAINYENLL